MRDFGEYTQLVSIIVPVYNKERFLAQTIESVQKQSYTNWELILIDDCSEDNSMQVAEAYKKQDSRICPVRQVKNQGVAKSRNRGIKEARGRYLCFLDADDIWEADKLYRQITFMKEKQCAFCFMGYEFADEQANGLGKIVHVPEKITYKEALKNTTIFTSTVMIDRGIVEDKDIFMPQIASEDTATWWQLLKVYGAGYGLDENLVKYRRSANTLSSNKFEAIKRIWNLYRKQEKLSCIRSMYCMIFWAVRAVKRRLV